MRAESSLSTPMVELRDVSFTYPNGVRAIDRISFALQQGQNIGIVGPSGCGKSTLLGLLSRLLRPTTGDISFSLPETDGRHPISMLHQRDTLLPWLTVSENVALFARFKGRRARRKPEVQSRVAELLEFTGLSGFANSLPHELSGGMRRRANFLASMFPNPQILLLDEPFASVDEPTRIGIHQIVFRMVKATGTSTVLVTHDLAEAITLTDVVVILSARPTRVAQTMAMPFGPVRDIAEIRSSSEYAEIYGTLWAALSREIRNGG